MKPHTVTVGELMAYEIKHLFAADSRSRKALWIYTCGSAVDYEVLHGGEATTGRTRLAPVAVADYNSITEPPNE
jgi:hypothetical protein